MIENELDLSRLRTVSTFDRGTSSTMAVGVSQPNLSPSSLLVESLIEQICKLMEKDPCKQRQLYLTVCGKLQKMNLIGMSYGLDEFQFIRTHYQKSFYNFLMVARKTMIENKAICSSIPAQVTICSEFLQEPSRYATEFIELGFIARGGFGHVFKAKHKLDGVIYAVKKIFLRYRNLTSFNNNLMEVKMLARFYHPNIVAYKAAWLEPVDPCAFDEQSAILPCSKVETDNFRSPSSESMPVFDTEVSQNDSLEVIFEKSSQTSVNESRINGSFIKVKENSEKAMCKVISKMRRKYYEGNLDRNDCAVLFIQMQFCNETLRHWIDTRNHSNIPVDMKTCLKVFKQIISGLNYIHTQNVVHHDIKPSNIFVSEDEKVVQLGDFGLACGLIHGTHCGVLDSLETHAIQVAPHRPGRIGTELYAAPEQLSGFCHSKSDIYSLGIVLFELLVPFHTSMERSKVIGKLKQGEVPLHLESTQPQLVDLIKSMLNKDCLKRPSASELLNSLEEVENSNVRKLIKEQEATIKSLREESLAKDHMIALLQQQLQELMARDKT